MSTRFRCVWWGAAFVLTLSIMAWPAGAQDKAGPPPSLEVTSEEGLFTVKASNATLAEIIAEVRAQSGVELDIPPVLAGQRVSLDLEGVSFEELMTSLAGSHALIYERDEQGNYRITSARLTSQEILEAQDLDRKQRREIRRMKKQIQKTAERIKDLYGFAGVLDYDEAKALIQQRKEQFDALVQELAALGPPGARAMQESFGEIEYTRAKLALINALELIDDDNASLALGALFEAGSNHSLEREMVAALGHRGTDPFTAEVLNNIVSTSEDERILAAGVMAYIGPGTQGTEEVQKDVLKTLEGIINSDSVDPELIQEVIRSVGEIGGEEALNVLSSTASSPGNQRVRTTAIQELGRTFGEEALPTLETLLTDPSDGVVVSSLKAISRIDSPAAKDVLKRTAEGGTTTAKGQEWAQAYLASSP